MTQPTKAACVRLGRGSQPRLPAARIAPPRWDSGDNMSSQERPGAFGVALPSLRLPMDAERSRNKGLLEASLAGLCELELLKQRQEARVLGALCLADPAAPVAPPWAALRSARCALDAPDGHGRAAQTSLQFSLEQQVAELKVNPRQDKSARPVFSPGDASPASSDHTVSLRSLAVPEVAERRDPCDPRKEEPSLEGYRDAQQVHNYMFCLIQRRALPTRPPKTRSGLSHDARVCVARQDSPRPGCVGSMPTPPQRAEGAVELGTELEEEASPSYHNFYHEPRQPSVASTSSSALPDYAPCGNSENNNHPRHPSPPEERLVSAEYIPAQPCGAYARAYAHCHSSPQKGSAGPKPTRGPMPQDEQQPPRCRGGPKKCRLNEERSGAAKRAGKKACRSQSENSLQRLPERDGGGGRSGQSRSRKPPRSSLDLSQDEAEQPHQRDQCARRARKARSTHVSYVYSHRSHNQHPSHHPHQVESQSERDQGPPCKPSESESSLSEADSPESSSLSSDSDESGGLVWPQQLPPQLALPSPAAPPGAPLQPKAFVKIKASHALKKKILRFRSGSLKVMTTV